MACGMRSLASKRNTFADVSASADCFAIGSGYWVTFLFGERAPPRLTQIPCASGVVRYFMSARDCGVSLNMPNRSPDPVTAPAYLVSMSGVMKKLKSSPTFAVGTALVKKSVMNEAWWCMKHFGGFANIGVPESPKFVASIADLPPKTIFGSETIVPQVCQAFLISALVHLVLPCHHESYTSGPDWRITMSSIQSVPGHPEAAPDSRPTHHGVVPESAIFFESAVRSSQVLGTV